MTTSYPALTDAVVCRVFTLKHKWACVNGVGSGMDNYDVGMAYRLDGGGPAPQTQSDAFSFDFMNPCYSCV